MKPKIEEGRHVPADAGMLRIRLECLKLAMQFMPGPYQHPDAMESWSNALVRYVLTGSLTEPAPVKPQYKPVEMTDAEDLS